MQPARGRAIGGIKATIAEMQEISDAVASTMEGQRSATEQIAVNTQEVASATTQVRANVGGVSESVATTGDAALKKGGPADDLTRQAQTLRSDVDRFPNEIRAA